MGKSDWSPWLSAHPTPPDPNVGLLEAVLDLRCTVRSEGGPSNTPHTRPLLQYGRDSEGSTFVDRLFDSI